MTEKEIWDLILFILFGLPLGLALWGFVIILIKSIVESFKR